MLYYGIFDILILFENSHQSILQREHQFYSCWYSPYTSLNYACVCLHICSVAQLCPTLCNPIECSLSGFYVHEISRQEHWRGYHFLHQGIFPTQLSNLSFLCLLHWQADSSPLCVLGNPININNMKTIDQVPQLILFVVLFNCIGSYLFVKCCFISWIKWIILISK